ncbi:MAG TPA: hypothetical protein VF193_07555 [Steroidobacter sp.]
MTDAVNPAETAAPDANVAPEQENVADSSPAAEETSEVVEQPKAKGVQKRLDELTRNWREEQRRNEQLLQLLQQMHRQQPTPEPPPEEEKLKTLADFDYDDARYQQYIFERAQRLSVEAARRELAAAQEREAAERRRDSFRSRSAEFAKTVPDFDAVAFAPELPITADMAEVIQESEDGPALLYHLGKNPEIAERIAKLPPKAAARELGRIEARLAYEREAAEAGKPKVSKAPPPPPKVDGSNAVVEKDPDEMTTEEWLKWREKQLKKRK